MNADLHMLTGAYALNALDDLERRAFEQHLAVCAECEREVRELRETAARLGSAVSVEPPPEMRSAVLDEIKTVRQQPPPVINTGGRSPRRWLLAGGAVAAAACLVAAVILGI